MHKLLKKVDNFLDRTTMYLLVFYVLVVFLLAALVLSVFGRLPFSPLDLMVSVLIITAVMWLADGIFARIFKAHTNVESVYITAFILALIISPPVSGGIAGGVASSASVGSLSSFGAYLSLAVLASLLAVASKYVLAFNRKHIFNPAAIAVAITGLAFNQSASWWVGTAWMMPFVLAGGALIVRKIRRADLVWSFLIVAAASILANGLARGVGLAGLPNLSERILLDTPLVFFACIMLTEPLTTPPSRRLRIWYGVIVGALFAPWVHVDLSGLPIFGSFLGTIYATPELALVAGNIFSYAVSPKRKLLLTLKEKVKQTPDVYDFVFAVEAAGKNTSPAKSRPLLPFKPGQYLEWTLAQQKPDNRGNRRYFTIASSPSELRDRGEIRMGVKFYPEPSTFKRQLTAMRPGDQIIAGQLAGDFVLPRHSSVSSGSSSSSRRKLVFIAGGIGVTPFRSMIKEMLDADASVGAEARAQAGSARRDITLLYSARTSADLAYKSLFDEAVARLGIKVVYVVGDSPADGKTASPVSRAVSRDERPARWVKAALLDVETITKEVPDYKECIFYISGPYVMVSTFKRLLKSIGIPTSQIKTDFFPGFA